MSLFGDAGLKKEQIMVQNLKEKQLDYFDSKPGLFGATLAIHGITVLLLSARDFLSSNSALKALRVNQSPFLRIILENSNALVHE